MRERRRASRGFTLLEMIVVMAIAGLLLGIALPFFGTITRRARVDSEARTISIALLQARGQAIRRGRNVYVEISTDPLKASYHTPIVFVDNLASGTQGAYDGADTIVARSEIAFGAARDRILIDDANKVAPSTASQTIEYIFTPFGSMAPSSTTKSVYVGDVNGNVLQVAVGTQNTGKLSTTKLSGSSYVSRPWTWS